MSDQSLSAPASLRLSSVISSVHYSNIKRASFDPSYKWQLIGNMKYTNKPWIDFISFCMDFPEEKQLYTYRLHAEHFEEEYRMMDERVEKFKELVEETKTNIETSSYTLESEK